MLVAGGETWSRGSRESFGVDFGPPCQSQSDRDGLNIDITSSFTNMPKRRRERDKPKSGPESLYNPNKRVLLSYASDEEETSATDNAAEPLPVDPAEAAIDDRTLANYQMDEYPDSENDAAPGAPVDESVDAYAREDGYGYARENIDDVEYQVTSTTWNNRGARDWDGPTLKPMLGPVSHGEGQDDEEEYDPDTEEAMAYLRAVRWVTSLEELSVLEANQILQI